MKRGPCYRCLQTRLLSGILCRDCMNKATTIKPCRKPTRAAPGSQRKIEIMSERFMNGEAIFHPLDAKIGEGLPLE